LVAKPIGIFATCERGGFLFQRATKPAKKLIAQNPPKDDLPTRATSGLVFARQAAAADVTGGDSRWQQAGNRSKAAWLVTRQNARRGAKMARNAKCAFSVAMALVVRVCVAVFY